MNLAHRSCASLLAALLLAPVAQATDEGATRAMADLEKWPEVREARRHMRRAWYREHKEKIPLTRALEAPADPDSFPPLDETYEALPAEAKLSALWDQRIQGTAYRPGKMPSLLKGLLPTAKVLLPHLLRRSLVTVSDEFPKARLKSIHTFGSTAKVEFVADPDSPYTGVFEGAVGLGRFSYAGPPILGTSNDFGVGNVPGLGLKFLIDGRPSENVVVMHGLNSQGPETSVFKKTFSNVLPAPRGPIMNLIRFAFERVVGKGNGFEQPLDNLARYRQDGTPVAQPKAPYRIFFEPVESYGFPQDSREDFREDLAKVKPGTRLYRVYAQDSMSDETRVAIGELWSRSAFVASSYGDTKLFFKHNATFLKKKWR